MSSGTNLPPTTNRGVGFPNLLSLQSQVDWITATTKDDNVGLDWLNLYRKVVKGGLYYESERHLKGFAGMGIDHLAWLFNPKNGFYMVIASSAMASEVWPILIQGAKNVTRIDLAVTVLLVEEDRSFIVDRYNSIPDYEKDKRQYALIQNTRGGVTLYVGKRTSQNFGRVYDKGVQSESHQPGNRYRYEVEIHKPLAMPVSLGLAEAALKGEDVSRRIADYVYQWFLGRGVAPCWQYDNTRLEVSVDIGVSTLQKRLNWLRTQVKPTIQELIAMGLTSEVFEALSLKGYEQLTLPGSE